MSGPRLIRTYLAPLSLLTVTTAIVTASAALGAALHRTGADLLVLLPLWLLAVAAVSVLSLDLAWRRHHDLALARLRGVRGLTALRVAAGPAVGAVATGALLGVAAAAAFTAGSPTGWPLPERLGPAELAWAAGTAAASAAVAAVVCLTVLRLPLAPPSGAARPQPLVPSTAAAVGGVGLVVVSAVTLYRAGQASAGSSALVLAGSAVLGLAAGQAMVWARNALAAVGGSRSTAYVLGVRRTSSRRHGAGLRLVVAAGVVATAAWSGSQASAAWAHESDLLRVGAPVQVALPDTSALEAWRLTRELDPDGQWLMAGAVLDTRIEAPDRAAYLDLERYDRVSGEVLATTSGNLSDAVAELRDAAPVQVVTGARLGVEATYDAPTPPRRIVVSVDYLGDEGFVTSVEVQLAPARRGAAEWSGAAPVPLCEQACVLLGIAATTSPAAGGSERLTLDQLSLGETDLVGDGFVVARAGAMPTRDLLIDQGYRPVAARAPQPVLTAGDPIWPDDEPEAPGIGGTTRPIVELDARAGLPLVVGAGLVGDLPVALAASRGSVTGVRSVVLARSDTPAEVLAGLAEAGAQPPVTTDPRGAEELGPIAVGELRLRQLVAAGAVGLALLGLLGAASWMSREARRDEKALRLVGVSAATRRRAALIEACLLGVGTSAATALGGWLAVRTLTDASALTPTGPTLLPPPSAADGSVLLVVVASTAGAWMLLVLRTRRPRSSPAAGDIPGNTHRAGLG